MSLISVAKANAGSPDWLDHRYTYSANGESISKVLEEFSDSYGLSYEISDGLQGPIYGLFVDFGPREFISVLSEISDMIWYFDGEKIHFYSSNDTERVILNLRYISVDALHSSLSKLSFWQEEAGWEPLEDHNVVLITGAPAFVALVQTITDLIDKPGYQKNREDYVLKMYRLRYASVSDYQYSYRGESRTIPGVLNLLSGSFAASGSQVSSQRLELSDPSTPSGKNLKGEQTDKKKIRDDKSSSTVTMRRPFLEADPRLNALLIGDTIQNHSRYKSLIESIDVPIPQIQIQVAIAHVQKDALQDLGVSWQAVNNGDFIKMGSNTLDGVTLQAGEIGVAVGKTSGLMSTMRWLERSGRGRIVSRPVLTTMENFEAVLDTNSTIYIRLTGRSAVELVPITVGTLMRVTPHIERVKDDLSVRLSIHIEDGQQTKQFVDNIPVLNRIVINTHATLREQQSLLIGGLYYQSEEESTTSVPILSNVPVVKNLFRSRKQDLLSTTRVFLISLRILDDFSEEEDRS